MADIKIIIGAEIKELESKLAIAKSKLVDLGQAGPRALDPLQKRLAGLTFPTSGIQNFATSLLRIIPPGALVAASVAGIGIAIAGAKKWFNIIKKDFVSVGDAAGESAKKIKEYKDIIESAIKSTAKEATEVLSLVSVLNNETETRGRKLAAIKELQKIQPEIFKGLKLEGEAVIGLDEAYKSYIANLKNVIEAKIIQANIERLITRQLELQKALVGTDANFTKPIKDFSAASLELAKSQADVNKQIFNTQKLLGQKFTGKQAVSEIKSIDDLLLGLTKRLTSLSDNIKLDVKEIKVKPEKISLEHNDKLAGIGLVKFDSKIDKFAPKVIVSPKIEFIIDPEQEKKVFDGLNALLEKERLEKFQAYATDAINETFGNILNDTVGNFADAIGDALSGGKDVVPRLFDNIMKGIGQQLKELGKYLVKIGLAKIGVDKAIKSLNISGVGAIAVGIGLQVLGALLINAATKRANQAGFASGTTGVQQGGYYNVGERGPERVFLPQGSSVQPNNEMNAYGGGGVTLQPSIMYEGTGFRIMLNRVDAQMGRNG